MKLIDTPRAWEDVGVPLYLNGWHSKDGYKPPLVNVHWRIFMAYPAAEKRGNVLGDHGLLVLPATYREITGAYHEAN